MTALDMMFYISFLSLFAVKCVTWKPGSDLENVQHCFALACQSTLDQHQGVITTWATSSHLSEGVAHRVPQRPAAGHDDGGLALRLSREPLAGAGTPRHPAALGVHLNLSHRHWHGDDQRHHGGLFTQGAILLPRRREVRVRTNTSSSLPELHCVRWSE